jgi:hypothetical protein
MRSCTCHPDDNPPVPCAEKYASSECRKVSGNHHTIMIHDCPNCYGEGRSLGAPSKWGDGSPTDYGPCQVCGGTGELEQEFECRTLEDLEAEGLLEGEPPPTV